MLYDNVRMTRYLLIIIFMSVLSVSCAQSWYGCSGCCGYVAGAAGWACCRVRGALYASCFNNSDCTVLNSQCILGCCQCPFPFYRQNSCQQCELIPRILGSQCNQTIDCARDIFRAVCVNNVCQCASAYKSLCQNSYQATSSTNNCQCVPRVLGDQCAQDLDCSTNLQNSVCSGSTCQCTSGFTPNVCGQCVPGQPMNTLAALNQHMNPYSNSNANGYNNNGFNNGNGFNQMSYDSPNGYNQINHMSPYGPPITGHKKYDKV